MRPKFHILLQQYWTILVFGDSQLLSCGGPIFKAENTSYFQRMIRLCFLPLICVQYPRIFKFAAQKCLYDLSSDRVFLLIEICGELAIKLFEYFWIDGIVARWNIVKDRFKKLSIQEWWKNLEILFIWPAENARYDKFPRGNLSARVFTLNGQLPP